ncbi:hypothetical protein ACFLYZ_01280 [Thermodesulfobacteriota bacterium]
MNLKKIKLVAGLLLYLGLILGTISCATYKQASALTTYVNQDILGISELEITAWGHYAAVTGKNFTTNEAVYEALKKGVIPTYQRFLHLLRKIDPPNDEVRQLHTVYVRGAEILYAGFKSKMIGLEKHDLNHIRKADAEIEKGVMETFKWRDKLSALYKKYNIVEVKK